MRVGIVDVGANTVRLLAAEVGPRSPCRPRAPRAQPGSATRSPGQGRSRPSGSKPPRPPSASLRARRDGRAACAWRRLSLPPGVRRRMPVSCARAGTRSGRAGPRPRARRGGETRLPGRCGRGRPVRRRGCRVRCRGRFDAARDRPSRPRPVVAAVVRHRLAAADDGGVRGRRSSRQGGGQPRARARLPRARRARRAAAEHRACGGRQCTGSYAAS